MDVAQIQAELDKLLLLYEEVDTKRADYAKELAALIPAEIRAKMDAVQDRQAADMQALFMQISALEKLVKDETLKKKRTIDAIGIRAAFRRGSFRWNNQKLMDYAKTHYQILAYRERGKPSVKIERK